MNPQYGQPPPVAHNYPQPPMNFNGNQMPPSNLPNQMASMSLNNDYGLPPTQKHPPSQFSPPPAQPQQNFGNLPPQHLPPQQLAGMPKPMQNAPPPMGQSITPANRQMPPNNNIPTMSPPPLQQNQLNGSQQNPQVGPPLSNGPPQPALAQSFNGAANPNYPPVSQQQPLQAPSPQLPPMPQPNRPPSAANASFGQLPQPAHSIGQPPIQSVPNGPAQPPAASQTQPMQKYPKPAQYPSQPGAPMQPMNAPTMQPMNAPAMHQPPMSSMNQPSVGVPPLPGQGFPPMPGQPHQQPMPGQQPPFAANQPPQFGAQKLPPMPQPQAFNANQPPQMYQAQQPPMPGYPQQQQQQPPMPGYPQPNMPPHMPQANRPYAQPPQNTYNQPGSNQYAGATQYPGMTQPQPQRRLDPDQMPNPIQVMAENQRSVTGPFLTNEIGAVPPLVTTKFITHDQGNSGPRFIRSTMYNVPATPDMMKQTQVPFSLVISPMAEPAEGEMAPPIVDFGELGPIRCNRCKAYMSPNMQFIDAGRRFRCALCKATTDVPTEYFQHLDHAGQRVDKYERPELVLGTYEFVATKEYCRENKPSKPPAFVFVIDVSYNNIKSGLVHLLCREMKNILENLPVDQGFDRTKMKVGFITYNNTVHFYNVKENLAQPQMMVVGDIHEMFMPLLDGFFCDAEESSAVIDALMDQIPKMFGDTRETETILLPAIQAGLEAIKASECAGKLLVFHSSLPVSDAPGRLQNREDRKLLGTEKEKAVLSPQNNAYNNLGQDCVLAGCSVDLFIFNNSYVDLATIGQVARLTGGEVYKYTYFQADIDGPRVIEDLIKNISRPIAFDAVMRVRTSAGIRPTDFYGHFFMSNTTDLDIASISSNKAVGIEIKHDDKLAAEDNVYLQVALLYTSCSGQRRIRLLNLALKTCTQMADLFRCCDLDAMVLYFAKQTMFKLLDSTPRAIREGLEARCAQILACYRKNCASPTSAGQLILPECMKLLPLYVSCMMKNDALSGGSDMSCDDRSYVMQFVLSMDLEMSVFYFYPRLIPIHNVDPNDDDIPAPIRCTAEKLAEDGAYILENGVHMFVWLGLSLAPEFTQAVFGAPCTQQIDTDRPGLPALDNPLSNRVRGIVNSIQAERPRCMRVTVVRSRDKLENVLRHFLIEDRSGNGAASYVDYLCHLHKEIRAILS